MGLGREISRPHQIRRYTHGVPMPSAGRQARWVGAARYTRVATELLGPCLPAGRRVIRDPAEYERIAKYIRDNPANWKGDRFNRFGPSDPV